jgi:hypothetical protein
MIMRNSIQQGDCILVPVSNIPKDAKQIPFSGIVLKGEGINTHELKDAESVSAYEHNGVLYLRLNSDNSIVHQEHGISNVQCGDWMRIIEREYDYETEEARQTMD